LLKSVASGADSLRIVRTLFQSPELRTAVANEAVSVTGTAGALNFGLRELIKTALKG